VVLVYQTTKDPGRLAVSGGIQKCLNFEKQLASNKSPLLHPPNMIQLLQLNTKRDRESTGRINEKNRKKNKKKIKPK
jgi:hypothetical protein